MYLNCHCFHSLRYGTIPLEELISQAVASGVKAMALTDINTVTGIYDFIKGCKTAGIKPIVGMEFRCEHKLRYIGLAKNASGLAEMNRFLTKHNFEKTSLPFSAPDFKDVFIIYPLENVPELLRDNEYIGIRPDQLPKLVLSDWKKRQIKMVILHPVTFRTKREYNLHRILRAIDMNLILSRLTPSDYCSPTEVMVPLETLLSCYTEYPQIILNTEKIVANCHFEFDFASPKNKKFYTNNRKDDMNLLTTLAKQGLEWRYGKNNAEAKSRMFKELKVIDQLQFSGYFLITWDIIRFSNSQGFLHIGRGSGANSIIAYCLGITDICPLELDLYFERFLNWTCNKKSDNFFKTYATLLIL